MRNYLNISATASGAILGSAQGVFASAGNATDTIVELLPVIIELAIVIAMLGIVFKLLKGINL
jgi:hypothetical protein